MATEPALRRPSHPGDADPGRVWNGPAPRHAVAARMGDGGARAGLPRTARGLELAPRRAALVRQSPHPLRTLAAPSSHPLRTLIAPSPHPPRTLLAPSSHPRRTLSTPLRILAAPSSHAAAPSSRPRRTPSLTSGRCAELAAGLEWLQLPSGGGEAEVHALMRHLDTDGDGAAAGPTRRTALVVPPLAGPVA